MLSDPLLQRLHDRLVRHGFTVVPFAGALELRTSLMIRLRVSVDAGRLVVRQRFGGLSPSFAALISVAGLGALAWIILMRSGLSPFSVGFCLISVLAAIWECLRFVVVEAATTRVHLLWQSLLDADDAGQPGALGAGPMRETTPRGDRAFIDLD